MSRKQPNPPPSIDNKPPAPNPPPQPTSETQEERWTARFDNILRGLGSLEGKIQQVDRRLDEIQVLIVTMSDAGADHSETMGLGGKDSEGAIEQVPENVPVDESLL